MLRAGGGVSGGGQTTAVRGLKVEVSGAYGSKNCSLYLDFGSGAGLFTGPFGEEGSSGMLDPGATEDVPPDDGAAWFFSDLSDLSDLEDRLMRFRNPPLLFFFSPS